MALIEKHQVLDREVQKRTVNNHRSAKIARRYSRWLLLGSLLVVSGCNTTANSNEWMGQAQALSRTNAMKRQGMMPVEISCMMDTSAKGARSRFYVKIEYAPNPSRRGWRYAVGETDEIQVHANTAKRENLKRVQSKQMFDSSTGRKGSCDIWHG